MNGEVIDIPLNGGLDLRDPINIPLGSFSTLDNADFINGLQRRHGHIAYPVVDDLAAASVPQYDEDAEGWAFGFGRYNLESWTTDALVRDQNVTGLRGTASRGDELLAWDGWRLFSRNTDGMWKRTYTQNSHEFPRGGVFPEATEFTPISVVGDVTSSILNYDVARGLKYTMYAWQAGTSVKYSVVENDSNKLFISSQNVTSSMPAAPGRVRVTYSSGRFYVTTIDATGAPNYDIFCYVFSEERIREYPVSNPVAVTVETSCNEDSGYDVKPCTDGIALLYSRTGPLLTLSYVRGASNAVTSSLMNQDTGGFLTTAGPVGLAIHPDGTVMAAWYLSAGTSIMVGFYDPSGNIRKYDAVNALTVNPARMTCEFRYLRNSGIYRGTVAATTGSLTSVRDIEGATTVGSVQTLADTNITHNMFRCGDSTFLPVAYYQMTRALNQTQLVVLHVDKTTTGTGLTPVISVMRGTIYKSASAFNICTSSAVWPDQDSVNPSKLSLAQAYGKVLPAGAGFEQIPRGVSQVDIDLLPTLRALNRDKTTWFPGGIVKEYDGRAIYEVNHLTYPTMVLNDVAGGSLDLTSVYQYRVYLCRRNAQGDLHRSTAVTKSKLLTGANQSVDIVLDAIPFCTSEEVYWEIYRTEGGGTLFYYLTTVYPSSLAAARSGTTTHNDTRSDASITSSPLDPAPAYTAAGFSIVDRVPPPACNKIIEAKSRLWFINGSVPAGSIAYSRLWDPGDAPAWNEGFVKNCGPCELTGVASDGQSIFAFNTESVVRFAGEGEDNLGNGYFEEPVPIQECSGCVSLDSVIQTPLGIMFQGHGGIRILPDVPIGDPIDSAITTVTASSHSHVAQQIRFHIGNNTSFVLDYSDLKAPRWSKWIMPVQALGFHMGKVVVVPDISYNDIWVEDLDVATDGGEPYTFAGETGWITPGGKVAHGRLTWLYLLGQWLGPHGLSCEVNYDYRLSGAKSTDSFTWFPNTPYTVDSTTVQDVGDGELTGVQWALGTFPEYYGGPYFLRHRFKRQKSSAFRFKFKDNSAENDSALLSSISIVYRPLKGASRVPKRNLG